MPEKPVASTRQTAAARVATGEQLDSLVERFQGETSRFTAALPAVARDDATAASQLSALGAELRIAVKLLGAPGRTNTAAQVEPSARLLASLARVLPIYHREIRLLEASLLAGDGDGFDDDAFAKKLEGMSDDELDRQADLLDECDDCDDEVDEIKALEREVDGLAGLKPPGRIAKIKAILLLAAELIIRLKNLPGAEAIRKVLRKLARLIDKTIKPSEVPGGGQTPEGSSDGGPSTEPLAKPPKVGACVVEIRIEEVTARNLDQAGGVDGWHLALKIDGKDLASLRGDFAGSPPKFKVPDGERDHLTTFGSCGPRILDFIATASRNASDAYGETPEWIKVECDGKSEQRTVVVRSHRGAAVSSPYAEIEFKLRVYSACVPLMGAPK